jgi:hypothetical protein
MTEKETSYFENSKLSTREKVEEAVSILKSFKGKL